MTDYTFLVQQIQSAFDMIPGDAKKLSREEFCKKYNTIHINIDGKSNWEVFLTKIFFDGLLFINPFYSEINHHQFYVGGIIPVSISNKKFRKEINMMSRAFSLDELAGRKINIDWDYKEDNSIFEFNSHSSYFFSDYKKDISKPIENFKTDLPGAVDVVIDTLFYGDKKVEEEFKKGLEKIIKN